MNIDRSPGDFERAQADQPRGPLGRSWAGVKRWSAENPRLSRVVWFAVALVLLALLIWAIYPAKNTGRRGQINNGAQPVGVARAVSGDINVFITMRESPRMISPDSDAEKSSVVNGAAMPSVA